jgi:hypothetical protein
MRHLARLTAVACATCLLAAPPTGAQPAAAPTASAAAKKKKKKPPVKAPKKSARYQGLAGDHRLILEISGNGRQVKLVFFEITCGEGTAATGLQNIALRKSRSGYGFGAGSRSTLVFEDDSYEEDVVVAVVGEFARNGKRISGLLRVKSERCGDTGNVKWVAITR